MVVVVRQLLFGLQGRRAYSLLLREIEVLLRLLLGVFLSEILEFFETKLIV